MWQIYINTGSMVSTRACEYCDEYNNFMERSIRLQTQGNTTILLVAWPNVTEVLSGLVIHNFSKSCTLMAPLRRERWTRRILTLSKTFAHNETNINVNVIRYLQRSTKIPLVWHVVQASAAVIWKQWSTDINCHKF